MTILVFLAAHAVSTPPSYQLLELSMYTTDLDLRPLDESRHEVAHAVLHNSPQVFIDNGLVQACQDSKVSTNEAEIRAFAFLKSLRFNADDDIIIIHPEIDRYALSALIPSGYRSIDLDALARLQGKDYAIDPTHRTDQQIDDMVEWVKQR